MEEFKSGCLYELGYGLAKIIIILIIFFIIIPLIVGVGMAILN